MDEAHGSSTGSGPGAQWEAAHGRPLLSAPGLAPSCSGAGGRSRSRTPRPPRQHSFLCSTAPIRVAVTLIQTGGAVPAFAPGGLDGGEGRAQAAGGLVRHGAQGVEAGEGQQDVRGGRGADPVGVAGVLPPGQARSPGHRTTTAEVLEIGGTVMSTRPPSQSSNARSRFRCWSAAARASPYCPQEWPRSRTPASSTGVHADHLGVRGRCISD